MSNLNWIAILSTVVLVATIVTIVFAFSAYFISMRVRQKKAAASAAASAAAKEVRPSGSAPVDTAPREVRILKPYNPFEAERPKQDKGKTWK